MKIIDTSSNNHIMGAYATNQKIHFGSPDNNVGAVSSFWIAGRETAANGGKIAADGSIMTLYQTKPIYDQFNPFNLSNDNYKENITVSLQDNQSGIYTGNAMAYSGTVTFQDGEGNVFSCPGNDITYQYSTDDGLTWNNGMPTDVGVYKIRAIAAAYDIYESAVSDLATFTVKGVPSARDFVFAAPENLTYDGTAKEAVITSGNAGMGEITVKYYKADGLTPAVGTDVSAAPAQAGEYIVKIDVAGGSLYIAASDVFDGSWSFTIEKAEPVYAAPALKEKEVDYGTKLGDVYSAEQLKNLLGVPKFNDGTEIPGTWSWADGTEASTGAAGTNTFKAIFTPDAGIINQFAWNLLPGWDETAGVISVDVPVKVKALPTDDGDSKLPPQTGDESPYFKVLGICFVMLLTSGLVLTAKKRKRA